MSHQCVNCGNLYDNNSKKILSGCDCGGKLFFFIKKNSSIKKAKEDLINLTNKDKKQIEKDVQDLIGTELDKDKPIVLELESIKILKPGKYELDLVSLLKKKPLIFKLEEGKYIIDLTESFKEKYFK